MRIDKFNLLIFILISIIIADQLYSSANITQQIDIYISNYEASIAILLSALLVLLYNKQQKMQNSQKELLEKQTDFQGAQHHPILIFEDIWLNGDQFEAFIKNVGNGPALNMYLFMGSGEPEQQPETIPDSSRFIAENGFTNTIIPTSESMFFTTKLNYNTFPNPIKQLNK